jgi:hypothetical protein
VNFGVRQFNSDFMGRIKVRLINPSLLSLIFVILTVIGCGRTVEKPLDNRTIDILTRMRIVEAHVVFDNGSFFTCKDDNEITEYRSLMSSLMPVTSHRSGKLNDYQYEMVSLGGKEPCRIFVKIRPDNLLEYQLGNFSYTGGDAKAFVKISGRMRSLKETRID